MDRPIEAGERRRQSLRRLRPWAVATLALVGALLLLRGWLRPSVRASRIRTAVVERGPVEAAILCSGQVVPAFEQVITCPFDTRVLAVLEQPGAAVKRDQPLVRLDDTDARLRLAELEEEVGLRFSRRRQLVLELEHELARLRGEEEIQREKLTLLEVKTGQQRSLHDLGLNRESDVLQAELDEKVARIELRQLGEAIAREQGATGARLEGLDLELELQQTALADQRERLGRATVSSDRDGVLTWVAEQIGAALRGGDPAVRVADLTRFRVEATVSDLHASRIDLGMPVRVVAAGVELGGHVSNVPPAVEAGVIKLLVELDHPGDPVLRPNLRVDAWVTTQTRPDALRVAKGPFVNGSGQQQVFVIRGGTARRVPVTIGLAGVDHYEVVSGLAEGDRVIVSDMRDFQHLTSVRVR